MQCDAFELLAADGTPLFTRCYRPATVTDRTLVLVHGASEHGDRYAHVVGRLVPRGWNVVLHDHRGHGHSGGPPMHVDDFDVYPEDLNAILSCLALDPARTVMMGHSMGALATIRFQQRFPGRAAGAVLMSPLLGLALKVPAWKLMLGHLVRYVWPRLRFKSEVREEDTTRTPEIVARRRVDRLVRTSVTAGWFFAVIEGIRRAWAESSRIDVPLLALQAGADRVVDPHVVESWVESTASDDRTFRWLADHYHELHHEPGWESTIDGIADWLDARIPVAEQNDHTGSFASAVESCRLSLTTRAEPTRGSATVSVAGS